jgi:uncharacterized membrane protein YfcA
VTAPSHLARDLAIGVGVGAFSGALGVGGGILLVPFLVLFLHWQQKRAQATSLVMIAMSGAAGALTYTLGDSVDWRAAGVIVVGGLAGSLIGSHIMQRTADHRLQILFGALLVVVSIRLLFNTSTVVESPTADLSTMAIVGLVISGIAMGILSALFGIGGGILLIPILVTFFGFGQQLAAGTSLAVIVPISLVGALRLSRPGLTDWAVGARYGIGAVLGAVLGATAALSVPGTVVRYIFAAVLALVAIRMIRTGWVGRSLLNP